MRIAFLLVAFALPIVAQDKPREDDARALAPKVTHYPTKFRLVEMGPAAMEPLLSQLDHQDRVVVFETKSALRWIVDYSIGRPLEEKGIERILEQHLTEGKPAPARIFSAELLGDLGIASAVPVLASRLQDPIVGTTALQSLVRIRDASAGEAIVKALAGAPAPQKSELLQALGRRHEEAALQALLSAAKDPSTREAAYCFCSTPFSTTAACK